MGNQICPSNGAPNMSFEWDIQVCLAGPSNGPTIMCHCVLKIFKGGIKANYFKGRYCPFETSMKIANAWGKFLPCDLKQVGKKTFASWIETNTVRGHCFVNQSKHVRGHCFNRSLHAGGHLLCGCLPWREAIALCRQVCRGPLPCAPCRRPMLKVDAK